MKSLSRAWLFATPWIVACPKLLCPWDFQGKSTGVGCHFLLQGIFPTQGSNPGVSHCRQTAYHLSHQGSQECSNDPTIALISLASKVILKILWAMLQWYMNQELSDVQAGFRKGRGIRDQIANIHWIAENQESSSKTSTSASLTRLKPLTAWITTNWKFWKRWGYQTTLPASWEICVQGKKQQLEPDMEWQTDSK